MGFTSKLIGKDTGTSGEIRSHDLLNRSRELCPRATLLLLYVQYYYLEPLDMRFRNSVRAAVQDDLVLLERGLHFAVAAAVHGVDSGARLAPQGTVHVRGGVEGVEVGCHRTEDV